MRLHFCAKILCRYEIGLYVILIISHQTITYEITSNAKELTISYSFSFRPIAYDVGCSECASCRRSKAIQSRGQGWRDILLVLGMK